MFQLYFETTLPLVDSLNVLYKMRRYYGLAGCWGACDVIQLLAKDDRHLGFLDKRQFILCRLVKTPYISLDVCPQICEMFGLVAVLLRRESGYVGNAHVS